MIIGAGLAGMIAAYAFPTHELWESRSREHVEHQALLRFRTPAISDITGIPFQKVTVHKGIWWNGGWVSPTIDACNMYSMKVIGRLADRSVWDIAPCVRWVPPHDFHTRLCDALGNRVHWNSPVSFLEMTKHTGHDDFIISTIPLPVMAKGMLGFEHEFHSAKIITTSAEVPNSGVYQTVYFPSDAYGLYRATLAGTQLTCEWTGDESAATGDVDLACRDVAEAFGYEPLFDAVSQSLGNFHTQTFGKLLPIDENLRKTLVSQLTQRCGIYSLGRFATWRNILLDDVVHDAAVIKRLASASFYERQIAAVAPATKEDSNAYDMSD